MWHFIDGACANSMNACEHKNNKLDALDYSLNAFDQEKKAQQTGKLLQRSALSACINSFTAALLSGQVHVI
jgi:hypothetical protein